MNIKTKQKIEAIQEAFRVEGKVSLRRIYYILGSKKLIKFSEWSYQQLSKDMVKWRDSNLIDPDMILDRRTSEIRPQVYDNFDEAFQELCDSFRLDSMGKQKQYVEVWIEKDTMTQVFYGYCLRTHTPLIVSKGFTTYSEKHRAINRFSQTNKPIVILYFGDFDPEGEYIPELLKQKFGRKIKFIKIVLTEQDIKKLPSVNLAINPKQFEKQYVKDFVRKYGKRKWEIEALSFAEQRDRFVKALNKEISLQVVGSVAKQSQKEVELWKKENLK